LPLEEPSASATKAN